MISTLALCILCALISGALSWLVSVPASTSISASTPPTGDEGFANLVAWMKLHGGRVDPRIDVTLNENGIRAVVALSTIEEGTELLFCPWKLVIGSSSMQEGGSTLTESRMCSVVERMAREIRLQSQSLWQPYLDHIGELPRLLATWEESALEELQGLPPTQEASRHLQWFSQRCGGDLDDASAVRSLVAFISRASEVGMVPIYDLLNHHNGMRNAKLGMTDEGVTLAIVGENIEPGREIFLSYGIKPSSTMYRDYGFVEEWPACWNFKDTLSGDNFAFVLFPHGIAAINPSAEYLKLVWRSNMSLREYETIAKDHTESLSVQDLDRFIQAVQANLGELQTTLGEDQVQLEESHRKKVDADSHSNSEDIISAIGYRIAFKSALTTSSIYAKSILESKMRSGSDEL